MSGEQEADIYQTLFTAPFVLTRASPCDMLEIVRLMYDSFGQLTREAFMGTPNLSDLPKLESRYIEAMRADPTDIWIKVTDLASGRIVAASNWKLYLGPESTKQRLRDEIPDCLANNAARQEARAFLEPSNELRIKENKLPFLCK
jgi:hypothetical protein